MVMYTWIFPSVIAALLSAVLLDLVYYYVWIEQRERHVLYWAQGWLLYCLRFVFTLFVIILGPHPALATAELLCTIGSSVLLFEGTYIFCGRTMKPGWSWAAGAVVVWSVAASFLGLPFPALAVPAFFFMGFVLIRIGVAFFRLYELPRSRFIAGLPVIVWGLHKFDYPFLRNVEWLAPWGFSVGAVCAVLTAVGFLFATLERSNRLAKQGQQRYHRILENAADGLFLADKDGRLIDVNKAACQRLGYTREELLKLSVWDVDPNSSPGDFSNRWAHMPLERVETMESVHLRKDGTPLEVEIRFCFFEEFGRRYALGLARDITERKRAEAAILAESVRRKSLMEISYDGIAVFNQHHEIVEANKRFLDNLGYTREELKTLRTWDFEVSMSEAEIRRNFGRFSNMHACFETQHRRKDGTVYDAEVSIGGAVINDEPLLFTITRDISERKRTEAALKDSEQRFRSLLENVSMVAVQGYDEERRVVYWNAASELLYGYSREEAMGRRLEDLIIPEFMREEVVRLVDEWVDNGTPIPPGELELLRKDGSLVKVYSSHVMQKNTLGNKEMYCVDVELTEIKRAHDQLLKAKEEAERANRIKSEFLANMSHEIRTPLNGIIGMLQLLNTTRQDEEQQEFTENALLSGRRLASLLSDILDVSALDFEKLHLQSAPCNIQDFVASVRGLFGLTATQKGVELITKIWPGVPKTFLADELRLQQVIFNLVGNGLKFTDKGFVSLEVSPLPGGDLPCQGLLFIVSDSGHGIPEDQYELAFETFGQVSQGYKRTHQGAGLGLAIVKRLVRLLGGNLSFESALGEGSSFYVSVPIDGHELLPEEKDELPDGPLPAEVQDVAGMESVRILVVEDERINALGTSRLLGKNGYTVKVAENGREALALIRGEAFDAVLMDVQMPVMDGVETTRAIRAGEGGEENRDLPIIAMTAYAMSGDKEAFLAAGMDDYLSKPVAIEELHGVLGRLLGPDSDA